MRDELNVVVQESAEETRSVSSDALSVSAERMLLTHHFRDRMEELGIRPRLVEWAMRHVTIHDERGRVLNPDPVVEAVERALAEHHGGGEDYEAELHKSMSHIAESSQGRDMSDSPSVPLGWYDGAELSEQGVTREKRWEALRDLGDRVEVVWLDNGRRCHVGRVFPGRADWESIGDWFDYGSPLLKDATIKGKRGSWNVARVPTTGLGTNMRGVLPFRTPWTTGGKSIISMGTAHTRLVVGTHLELTRFSASDRPVRRKLSLADKIEKMFERWSGGADITSSELVGKLAGCRSSESLEVVRAQLVQMWKDEDWSEGKTNWVSSVIVGKRKQLDSPAEWFSWMLDVKSTPLRVNRLIECAAWARVLGSDVLATLSMEACSKFPGWEDGLRRFVQAELRTS